MPKARTSASHPLRIAAVTPGNGYGRIGVTLCPGKTDPAGMTGAWARDLDTDLDAVQHWGATAVVSLITDEELDFLSVRDLPGAARDRHMEWWHAPIPDGWPPGTDFEDAWATAGEAIRDRLRLGFDVLVHCRGGLGRAGTVAARLLVELGASPDDAIRCVRDARSPYAIETASQEAHVARCAPCAPSVPPQTTAGIRRQLDHPVYLDENTQGLGDVMDAIGSGLCDGFGFKVSRLGGLSNLRTARDICKVRSLPHTCDDGFGGDIISAACAHAGATVEAHLNEGVWISEPYHEVHYDPHNGIAVSNGHIALPTGPGLGITPAPDRLGAPVASYG